MLYLRTGGNGSGKTLFTLQDVRKLQLETGRPVCINIRPADYPDKAKANTPYCNIKPAKLEEFGWKLIHFKDWEAQEDGTIFLVDECHYDLPQRPPSQFPPPHIAHLTEHRSRGFDFFLLTQHPGNIDKFVRNLVQAPGWHEHVKRLAGAAPVSNFCRWDSVQLQCESMGSGRSGEVKARPFPREVYDWYDSAFLHTGKLRIPKKVWVLLACLVLAPLLLFFGVRSAYRNMVGDEPAQAAKPSRGQASGLVATGGVSDTPKVKSATEYIAAYRPRIGGLVHSAPAYDKLTEPKRVPVPAACVQMGDRCSCYTQDATPYTTSPQICAQIVKAGIWLDFEPEGARAARDRQVDRPAPPSHENAPQAPSGLVVIGDMPQTVAASPAPDPAADQAKPRVPKSSPWSFSTAGG